MKTAEYWLRPAVETRDLKDLRLGRTSNAGASAAQGNEGPSLSLLALARFFAQSRLRPSVGVLEQEAEDVLVWRAPRQCTYIFISARSQGEPPPLAHPSPVPLSEHTEIIDARSLGDAFLQDALQKRFGGFLACPV